jgi:eukaryotic-like serine/threonine-protein kinase
MSNDASDRSTWVEFGPFRVDLATGQVWRGDEAVALPPRTSSLLLVLLAERHRVVEKDELLRRIWPDAFVAEDSLTQAVSGLRKALNDTSRKPAYILTVPTRGYRFIGDLRNPSTPESPYRPAWIRTPATLAAVAAGALLVAAWLLFWHSDDGTGTRSVRFVVLPPTGTALTSGGMLSPDGKHLAFTARDGSGRRGLFVRDLDGLEARLIPGTDDAQRPFWSPDSAALGFFAHGLLKTTDIDGQRAQTLTSVGQSLGGAWGRDGRILFTANRRSGLYAIPASGGLATAVTLLDQSVGEAAHRWPQFAADGQRYFFWLVSSDANREGAYVADVTSGHRQRILDGGYSAVVDASPTQALTVQDRTLIAIPIDRHGMPNGVPHLLARDVAAPDPGLGLGISAAGTRALAYLTDRSASHLAWFDRSGSRIRTLDGPSDVTNPVLSPDDSQLVVQQRRVDGEGAIWLVDLARGTRTLTAHGTVPLWSPDGRSIAFTSGRTRGVLDIYRRLLNGPADDELILRTASNKRVQGWSPNSQYLVYVNTDETTKDDLWLLPISGDRNPVPYLRTPFNERGGQISPDGHWMAYVSDESGSWEVYVQSLPQPEAKRAVSVHGGLQPQWARNGRELFFLTPEHVLMSVDIRLGTTIDIGIPKALFRAPVVGDVMSPRNQFAASVDGDRFLIETADDDAPSAIVVVLNWSEELQQRVSSR